MTFAAAIGTEDRARLAVEAMAMLARHHATVEPLVQVSAPGPVVARTEAGALLVPVPLDYVPWTEQVAKFAARPEMKARLRGGRLGSPRGATAGPVRWEDGTASDDLPCNYAWLGPS